WPGTRSVLRRSWAARQRRAVGRDLMDSVAGRDGMLPLPVSRFLRWRVTICVPGVPPRGGRVAATYEVAPQPPHPARSSYSGGPGGPQRSFPGLSAVTSVTRAFFAAFVGEGLLIELLASLERLPGQARLQVAVGGHLELG